jgi:hypothetical protein
MDFLTDEGAGYHLVTTESGSRYWLDLDRRVLLRRTNELAQERLDLRRDGEDIGLIEVVQCRIGEPMLLSDRSGRHDHRQVWVSDSLVHRHGNWAHSPAERDYGVQGGKAQLWVLNPEGRDIETVEYFRQRSSTVVRIEPVPAQQTDRPD